MRLSLRLPSAVLIGLFFGLLFTMGVGSVQTTAAQQPSLNLNQPVQSIDEATATVDSDARLVDLATVWMKARADTEISYSTYRKGVRFFQQKHPGFYGNFFGEPFYATYDVDYFKMTRYRHLASHKVNPLNGLSGMFSCHPLTYDPAFNGRCRGFQFAATDFFILPSGSIPATASLVTPLNLQSLSVCQDGHGSANRCASLYTEGSSPEDDPKGDPPNRPDERFVRPDTTQRSPRGPSAVAEAPPRTAPAPSQSPTASIDDDNSSVRVKPVQTRPRLSPRIDDQVARKVNESIQRRAASLERVEQRIRIRQRIRKKFGSPESLTPEERAEIGSQLAKRAHSRDGASWSRDQERADVRRRLERSRSSHARERRHPRVSDSKNNRSTADRPENNSTQHRKPKQRRKPKPKEDLEESGNN